MPTVGSRLTSMSTPEMPVLAHGDDGAEEGQPDEQQPRHLLGHRDARVEGVAQHDVAEDQHHHQRQEERDQDLQQLEIAVDDRVMAFSSARLVCSASAAIYMEAK